MEDYSSLNFMEIKPTRESAQEVADWCRGVPVWQFRDNDDTITAYVGVNVPTADGGVKRAQAGDRVVQMQDGEHFDVLGKDGKVVSL